MFDVRQHPPVQEMFSRIIMFTKPHTTRERGKGNRKLPNIGTLHWGLTRFIDSQYFFSKF